MEENNKMIQELMTASNKKNSKDFTSSFSFKCLIVFILILIFQIPMQFIRMLIEDRDSYHNSAIESILIPKGGEPNIEGILIAVPYDEAVFSKDDKGVITKTMVPHTLFVTPENYNAMTSVQPEILQRGIFDVPVFSSDVKATGSFDGIESESIIDNYDSDNDVIYWEKALMIVGISNKKNLVCVPEISVSGKNLKQSYFDYSIGSPFTNSVYYDLGKIAQTGFNFDILIKIQGGRSLSFTPIATSNQFTIESSWSTPGFEGGWLPQERNITDTGFRANWSIPGFSTQFAKRWSTLSNENTCRFSYPKYRDIDSNYAERIQVNFYQPVNNYQKSTRSAKYSLLFLMVPFIALLIFEVFSKVRIHPIQYCLIGFANVVFYLLLISVSEHISFNLTYWISSIAVSLLMFLYGSSIFRKLTYGIFFALVNFVSYIFLFGTLQAEDYALLIGSIGIFIVVCVLMILTRKIDWYRLSDLKFKEDD